MRAPNLSLVCLLALSLVAKIADAATFTVINTNDAGAGSLRQAIINANGAAGPHDIDFAIPGAGPHTIALLSELPQIVEQVEIDGSTQPGASANTNPLGQGLNTVLRVALDGTALGASTVGLDLNADLSRVLGLAIFGFDTQVQCIRTCEIFGNFIGTNLQGNANPDPGQELGISILGSDSVVGSVDAVDRRNLISGLQGNLAVFVSAPAEISGNLIGTDAPGTAAIGNLRGITVDLQTTGEVVIQANLLSDNESSAITYLSNAVTDRVVITRNTIGLDVSGTAAIPNGSDGILLRGTFEVSLNSIAHSVFTGIRVLPPVPAMPTLSSLIAENVIFENGRMSNVGSGIVIQDVSDVTIIENEIRGNGTDGIEVKGTSEQIRITENRIFDNDHLNFPPELGLSIDLGGDGVTANDLGDGDVGPNTLQNHPEILSAVAGFNSISANLSVDGAAVGDYTVELFGVNLCSPERMVDADEFLGSVDVASDGNGDFMVEMAVPTLTEFPFVTATATDPNGNTSELAPCVSTGTIVVEVPTLSTWSALVLAGLLALVGLRRLAG
jgi:parallel beta-helix repeat protein